MYQIKRFGDARVMSVSEALKISRHEIGISKYMPITHLNEPTIFEASNTMIGSVIAVAGVPFDTERNEILNNYKRAWHRALIALNEEFCIYTTMHRHKENIELNGKFNNDFARELDQRYHTQFKSSAMYINDIYITVIYKGITTGRAGKGISFMNKLTSRAIKSAREYKRQEQIKALKKAVNQLLASLSVFRPRLLGSRDQEFEHSELLSFLGILLNGGECIKFNFTSFLPAIAKSIKDTTNIINLYPYGNLAQYITNKRIFFGENIQFQGSTKEDSRFAAMVTIKQYATGSASLMLDTLLHLDCDFISTNTFAFEAKDIALNHIQRHMIRMENVNDPAVSQIEQLHIARDMIASGGIAMGYHHNTVMLITSDQAELESKIAKAIKCYADAGFIAIKETIGQEPAFWAQIPTNLKYIARSAMITSENYVDFAPLHNYRTGFRDGNHLGSAVTLLETPSKTPFFFNFHVKGSKDNPSKGHTTVIGGNGCGKTVAMGFLDAQITRYGGRTFAFDRDRGLEIYLRACGGYYAILSPDYPNETCFNPLQMEDTPVNRKFCREWMVQLVKQEDEKSLDPETLESIIKCIDYAFEHLAHEHRNLTNVSKLLPISFSRWPSLRRWLCADGKHAEGEYAYIFDNNTDALEMHTKMGFDMTHFLDNEPSNVLAALTMYLFHRLKQSLDGRLVTVLLDEGWQYLDNYYWQISLKKFLPTFRKLNCHLVFATQSPSSVIESPLRNMILDNCATNIYFANPQAKEQHYIDGFNLTESEFTAIKSNEPNSRLFLVKQEHESALCKLNLAHMPDALAILSANKSTINLLDSIRQEAGDNPKDWLPLFHQRRCL